MYASAGTSSDFAHGAAHIPYCYLIELRSKEHRFKLPKEQIEETGQEILNSVIALMEFVDNYRFPTSGEDELESQLRKNESVLESCSIIKSANNYIKKCESYNKNKYSFIQNNNAQHQGSYVNFSQVSMPRNAEDSSDADWSDSIDKRNDCNPKRRNHITIQSSTSEKETEPYKKHLEPLDFTYDLLTGKINYDRDELTAKSATFTSDTSDLRSESLTESENSYDAFNRFYKQQNNFHNTRRNLFKTGATYTAEHVERYIFFIPFI